MYTFVYVGDGLIPFDRKNEGYENVYERAIPVHFDDENRNIPDLIYDFIIDDYFLYALFNIATVLTQCSHKDTVLMTTIPEGTLSGTRHYIQIIGDAGFEIQLKRFRSYNDDIFTTYIRKDAEHQPDDEYEYPDDEENEENGEENEDENDTGGGKRSKRKRTKRKRTKRKRTKRKRTNKLSLKTSRKKTY